ESQFPSGSELLRGLKPESGSTGTPDSGGNLGQLESEIRDLQRRLGQLLHDLEQRQQPDSGGHEGSAAGGTEGHGHSGGGTAGSGHSAGGTDGQGHGGVGSGNQRGFLFGGNSHTSLESIQQQIGGHANLEMFPVRPGNAAEMQHVRDDLARGVTPE